MTGRVLLTGATGFIGGHLHRPLRAAGWEVRCLTRRPAEARARWPDRAWVGGDVGEAGALAAAMEGCRAAFYLIHGMGQLGPGWAEREVRAAETFARAASEARLERLVYLGGVAPAGPPSEHLRARLQTGEALRAGTVPCLELRAGMIIGEGSASWTIVRDLAARLPAMVLPAWLKHRSEPLALDDVAAGLVAATRFPLPRSEVWDLPGPEALSGNDILRRVAAVMGRRPVFFCVPFVSPSLSSHWIRLVTRADYRLAAELIEGLTSDLLATRPGFWAAAGLSAPIALEEAARRALAAERDHLRLRSIVFEAVAGALTRPVRRDESLARCATDAAACCRRRSP
jgi:uncharacterized protein YbjT (DUF2867 family)